MVFGISGRPHLRLSPLHQDHQHASRRVPHVPRVDHQGSGKKPRRPVRDAAVLGQGKGPCRASRPRRRRSVRRPADIGLLAPLFPPGDAFPVQRPQPPRLREGGGRIPRERPVSNTPSGSRRRISRTPVSPGDLSPRRGFCTIPSGSIPRSISGRRSAKRSGGRCG